MTLDYGVGSPNWREPGSWEANEEAVLWIKTGMTWGGVAAATQKQNGCF